MAIIDTLMELAAADTDLLRNIDAQGDDFTIPRDVDFLLRAPSEEDASLAADFINDHSYGAASVRENEGRYSVLVVVYTPVTQPVILSLSGFMACISHLFRLDYDGWGCVVQARR